jgi:hypothetical protein
VRRCAVALGHAPTAAEFAAWANARGDNGAPYRLFGRPITEREAAVILHHPARPVSARDAAPHEQLADNEPAAANVISIGRIRLARQQRRHG